MRRSLLVVVAAALAAALTPAQAGAAAKQAYFDVSGSGRWAFSHVSDVAPGSECPLLRGRRVESQSVNFKFSRRVKIQHAYGRTYVTPVGRGARLPARATVRQSFEDTLEKMWCESGGWVPDRDAGSESKTCARTVGLVLDIERGRARLFPVFPPPPGACRLDSAYDPYPTGVEKLDLRGKVSMRRLLGRSSRRVAVRSSARRSKTDTSVDPGSVWTDTDTAEGSWQLTLRRRGRWRPWR